MTLTGDRFTAEQLDAVAGLIPIGIIRMDRDGNCLHVNERWSLLTGLAPDAALGEGWKQCVAREDRERVVRKICEAGADAGEFAEEFRLCTPDGPARAVSSRVLPLRGSDGVIAGYIATIADLTERYQTEDALRDLAVRTAQRMKSQQLLREREQELQERLTRLARVNVMGELAASIAHEVSQPLAAIAAYAQGCRRLLQAEPAPDPVLLDAVSQIAQEALRAGAIVERLHHLSRKRHDQRVPRDINELIRDIQPLAAVDARLHDVRLVFDLDDAIPPINADGVQLQQVLLNLIRNSIDAMAATEFPAREAVVRTARRDDGSVEISVSDRGCGLAEDAAARLFEPFFTTKETGIGMGLAISRSIVDAHRGRMWFTRNPGGGTTFHFSIPGTEGRS